MRRDRLKEMANFAIHLRIPPSEYWALTLEERDAIVTAFNRTQKG